MTVTLGSTICRETLIESGNPNRIIHYGRDLHRLFGKVDVVSQGYQNGPAPRPPELWTVPGLCALATLNKVTASTAMITRCRIVAIL